MSRDPAFFLRLADVNLAQGETEAAAACLESALQASADAGQREQVAAAAERLLETLPADDPGLTRARWVAARARGLVEAPDGDAPAEATPAPAQAPVSSTSLPLTDVVAQLLATDLEIDQTAQLALDLVIKATGAELGHIVLADAGHTAFGVPGGPPRPPETSSGILEEVARTRATVVVGDAQDDPRFSERASVQELNIRSVLCIPVLGPGDDPERRPLVGALYLQSGPDRFGPQARRLGETLANLIGIPLWKAHRFQEQSQALARAERLYAQARESTLEQQGAPRLLGRSPAMHKLQSLLDRVAPGDHTVLIEGESGTGKELVARAIHTRSDRRDGPFVAENMGALAETLLAAELFGNVKGAYTGADEARPGLFRISDGGTLLLDEIGEMSLDVQAKLLRVLEEREIRPVGGSASLKVNVRIVAATHRDLQAEVRAGRFREDLYYRLSVIKIRVPPLRERTEDIPLLLEHFLGRAAADLGLTPPPVAPELLTRLRGYGWPGNVRELLAYATRLILGQGVELGDDTPSSKEGDEQLAVELSVGADPPLPLREARVLFDKAYLRIVLKRYEGNVSATARALGLNRSYLSELVKRYQLKDE